jgi:hypothetical protein
MLKLDDFAPLVGEAFALVDGQDGRHSAALVEARALGTPAHGGRQPFALLFEGPGEPALPQCVYRVQHPAIEPLDMFLVPVGRASAGVQYEAIFN